MESQELRKAGLKVTHPRMKILELLEQIKPRHMAYERVIPVVQAAADVLGAAIDAG